MRGPGGQHLQLLALPGREGVRPASVRPDPPLQLRGRQRPVQPGVLAADLRGVGRQAVVLGHRHDLAGRPARQRLHQQVPPQQRQPLGQGGRVVGRADRRAGARPGPGRCPARPPSASGRCPVSASPARIAAEIGAAPRWRGNSEAWTFRQPSGGRSSTSRRRIRPYAATTITSGAASRTRANASGGFRLGGWKSGRPRSRANAATGGGVGWRPRPPAGPAGPAPARSRGRPRAALPATARRRPASP